MLQMPQGLLQLHHHATCHSALIFCNVRTTDGFAQQVQREQQCWQLPAVPIGRAKSLKRPAHPAVLGLMYVFRGLRRKSGRSQDLPDR